jgi:hypothetical protein
MNTRNLPLAGLLLIGAIGASDYIAPTAIDDFSISGAHIAEIARPIEINDIQLNPIGGIASIAANNAIAGAILNNAIGNIINDDIQADLIETEISEIAA